MRTNIDIDDDVLEAAMKAGSFKTKKDAVEAGLRLIARQGAYREILRWEGKLHWEGDAEAAEESSRPAALTKGDRSSAAPPAVQEAVSALPARRRHAGR